MERRYGPDLSERQQRGNLGGHGGIGGKGGIGGHGGIGGNGGNGGFGGKGGNFAHSVALWGGGVLGRHGGVGGEDEKKENSKRSFLCLCECFSLYV
jgi:hypothetical protein